MNFNPASSSWRAALLGATNGLLFGIAAWLAFDFVAQYESHHPEMGAARLGLGSTDTTRVDDPYQLTLLYIILFTIASHLLHRYWKDHRSHIVLLWVWVGVIGVTTADLLFFFNPSFSMGYLRAALWVWAISLIMVILFNFIYGGFMKISLTHYSQEGEGIFP